MTESNGRGVEVREGLDWVSKHLVECVDERTGQPVPVEFGLLRTRDGLQMAMEVGGQGEPVLVSLVAAPKIIEAVHLTTRELLTAKGWV